MSCSSRFKFEPGFRAPKARDSWRAETNAACEALTAPAERLLGLSSTQLVRHVGILLARELDVRDDAFLLAKIALRGVGTDEQRRRWACVEMITAFRMIQEGQLDLPLDETVLGSHLGAALVSERVPNQLAILHGDQAKRRLGYSCRGSWGGPAPYVQSAILSGYLLASAAHPDLLASPPAPGEEATVEQRLRDALATRLVFQSPNAAENTSAASRPERR
jgi:hypothetical protein